MERKEMGYNITEGTFSQNHMVFQLKDIVS